MLRAESTQCCRPVQPLAILTNDGISDTPGMKRILAALVDAAAPFLVAQLSSTHFEYMGVDFMIDEVGLVKVG